MQIDFGDDNGYVNVTANTTKTVYYSTSGIILIKVKQGGMESVSEFNFVKRDIFYESSILPISGGGEEMRGFMSVSQPMLRPFLGCDNVLDRPIIVVEGFEIERNEESDAPFQDILDILNGDDLVDRLQALGYDFVVVKFSDNAASIYENALALRSAINEVNATKTGNNKLHIIGLSMGGLTAKYCLKDIEDNNLDHNAENYFSYDSPHQGAYVPLGLQHLVISASQAMKEIREDRDMQFILSRLRSTAGKQFEATVLANNITPFDDIIYAVGNSQN